MAFPRNVILTWKDPPKTMTDQINTIVYKYSPDYAARLTFIANGDNWIVASIFFGNSQFTIELE